MGNKVCLVVSYGPFPYPGVPECFTMAQFSQIFIEVAIWIDAKCHLRLWCQKSPVSLQWCEKDFYAYIILESIWNAWVQLKWSELFHPRAVMQKHNGQSLSPHPGICWCVWRGLSHTCGPPLEPSVPSVGLSHAKEDIWEAWRGGGAGWDALTWVSNWESSFSLVPTEPSREVPDCYSHCFPWICVPATPNSRLIICETLA